MESIKENRYGGAIVEIRYEEGGYVTVDFDGGIHILSPGDTYRVVLNGLGEATGA